MDSILYAYGLV